MREASDSGELKVHILAVSMFATNCYLACCPVTGEAVVIDPGADGKRILEMVEKKGLKIKYIINTHAHVDHIGANGKLKEALGTPILLGEKDLQLYKKPAFGFSFLFKKQPEPDHYITDGDRISFGNVSMEVKETPGHSPGSISLVTAAAIFCGDTLFAGSVGRTDFPGCSYNQLLKSIHEKILVLPPGVKIYPGHGPVTTVGKEAKSNPFVDDLNKSGL